MCTINGKDIKTVFAELSVHKECGKKLYGKYDYYTIAEYEQRLDNVVGSDHYTVEYTEPQVSKLSPSDQIFMTCKCRITLLDDNYEPVLFKEGLGAKEFLLTTTTQKYDGLGNFAHNCSISAFKFACQKFHIFGVNSSEENEYESPQKKTQDKSKAETIDAVFWLTKAMQPIEGRTDRNTGRPVYRMTGRRIVDNQTEAIESDIIFYPNQYDKCESFVNEMCTISKTVKVNIKVSPSSPRDGRPQYVFKDLLK